jgi:hypothetical protein
MMAILPWAIGAAVLGTGAYFLWPGKDHEEGQPPDQGEGDTPEAPEQDAEKDTTPVDVSNAATPATPATHEFHPGPFILPAANASVASKGRALPAARDLYAFLSKNGSAPSTLLHRLVLRFQRVHNSDPLAIRLAGRLPRTGYYDARTSATLTMYTGNPIPASVNAPSPPSPDFGTILNPNIPGNAALMGYNLGVDVHRRGLVHDERQRALVREYQRAINRDPKFPGAMWTRANKPLFRQRIKENGRWTPDVERALHYQMPRPFHA